MWEGLARFKALYGDVPTIVDVGAAEGKWSLKANRIFRQSSFVLFEPLLERRNLLENLTTIHSTFHYVGAAAGNEKSTIQFNVTDDLDGSGISSSTNATNNVRSIPVTRIDMVVEEKKLTGPFIIKLDTHGFEVPILQGCERILNDVELFIIECYGFRIADKSLLFWEMCAYMESLGFRVFDVVSLMNRPKDGAFWQCDIFFIKKDKEIFKYNSFK
jgi:FkbM family methyltransferase